ncbi:hypothetical protein [Arthrobacter sp. NPDC090010]|uniref:hypothetical protein n=1 Tax=Arthrobacter sp. NPDC090010 TaxID=3363942 RepID=UPI0038034F34
MSEQEVVNDCYQKRYGAWDSARTSLLRWLNQQCDRVLEDGDRMRLSVHEGRIRGPDRTLVKLQQKLEDNPGIQIRAWQDIETELGDLVGMKVLCKSTRDRPSLRAGRRREQAPRSDPCLRGT